MTRSTRRPFRKILVANRGEIGVRIFRACTELRIATVAIYSYEDRHAIHRYKADEAYEVGVPGDPIGAYLAADEIVELARRKGVEAIHPGYGFLSENAAFARACQEAGIAFIGPPAEVIERMGDKNEARDLAHSVGVPTPPGMSRPAENLGEIETFAASCGFPILLKATFGGGGRGMRVVRAMSEVEEAYERATSEAKAAFGRGEVFAEKFIERPRHIEVQILADCHGNLVHLYERDCSIQRRHQKLVEIAPAPSLPTAVRQRLFEYALSIARGAGYSSAGTVEFLVAGEEIYFLEVNPRIQVEHTVTEMVTGCDIVQAMIQIAAGRRLDEPEIGIVEAAAIPCHGVAIQCRITTEDPAQQFAPDTGKIRVYRSAAGFGIRLDSGIAGAGSVITPHYDSLVVKVTSWAPDLDRAAAKLRRSLMEFRIRGVKTNIPFLQNVINHRSFLEGGVDTSFIDETPELFEFPGRRDRATRTLRGIAEILVNGPPGFDGKIEGPRPSAEPVVPPLPDGAPPVGEAMRVLTERGPEGLARWTLDQKRLLVTDTTFRDAHQSLLATRVRTADLAAIAPATAHLAPGLWSHEIWGGATFDVCLRFLKEDPWERLVEMRSLLPNVPFQMLLRGVNIVGYTSYPDGVVRSFIEEAASAGIDIFRIFDALNYLPNMTLAIEEVARVGRVAEAAICYTSDVLTSSKYDLDYYLDLATELERRGAHVLAIKDMAGLLKPYAAKTLVSALKDRLSIPIHLHTHDTSGNGVATCLMAAEAGVDVVDGALSSMSGLTSQPSLDAIVAALDGTARETGLDSAGLMALSNYWEGVRELYHPFESGLRAGTTEVYVHEIPGGQYSNLRPRAVQLGLGDRWELIKRRYREVDLALGGLIKVTPTSKVVADFAMFLVQNDLSVDDLLASEEKFDLPRSVIDFFQGGLGEPYGGFPEPLRRVVLRGTPPVEAPGASGVPESVEDLEFPDDIESALYRSIGIRDRLSYVLYPQVFREYVETRRRLGDLSRLPTRIFLHGIEPHQENLIEIEEGKTLIISLLAVGDVKDTGEREVYFELNGMFREVLAVDRSVSVETARRVQADPDRPEEVGAPMRGIVSSIEVAVGEEVAEGQPLVVTEAMKVETAISAPVAGRVETIDVKVGETVEAGDRIVRLDPEE